VDQHGLPRPLHIEQAFQCIDFERGPVDPVVPAVCDADHVCEDLLTTPVFAMRRHVAADPFSIPTDGRFHVLLLLTGAAEVRSSSEVIAMPRGSTVLLPARRAACTLHPRGRAAVLDIFLPDETVPA
jgi:mannose-6-phosphate isomerase